MSSQYFPDPHEDLEDDDFEVSDDRVGGSPLDEADIPKRGSRKGLFGILIAVAGVIGVLVFASKGDEPESRKSLEAQPQLEDVELARPQRRISVNQNESPNIVEQLNLPEEVKEDVRQRQRTSGTELIEPTTSARVLVNPQDIASRAQSEESAAQRRAEEEVRLLWGPEDVPSPGPEPAPNERGRLLEAEGSAGTDLIMPQRTREDSIRRAEEERRRQEIEAAKELERQRLRSRGTLLAQNSQIPLDGRGFGVSRYGDPQASSATSSVGIQGQAEVLGSGTPDVTLSERSLTPGLRIPAVLTSEFRSGVAGAGAVEARLLADLADNGRVVLPAGTKAYGRAQASPPRPGEQARVSIVFSTFVTPSGEVLSENLTGHAVDPQTLAMSIPADVDHNYAGRIGRGLLATGLDYLLTRDTRRRSIYETESPHDRMVEDARGRISNIVGDVGADSGASVAVYLPANSPIMVAFGLENI